MPTAKIFMFKRIKQFIGICLLLAISIFVYHIILIYDYSKQYNDTVSDVAIVLGAGSSGGKISPVFRERVNQAIKLFKTGKVNSIILTGGHGKNQAISDSKAAMHYAIKKGVAKEHIFIEEKSDITWLNLTNARQIMKQKHFKTALLVSDPFHMKRAMHMCRQLGMSCKTSPTQTSMFRSWKTKLSFLCYESFFYSIGLVFGHSKP